MEYDVNRIEFVKTQYVIQTSKNIFLICIDCIVQNDIFFKSYFFIMFLHVLWNVLSALLTCICWAQVFLCDAQTDVFTSKYFIIQWVSTNGNST